MDLLLEKIFPTFQQNKMLLVLLVKRHGSTSEMFGCGEHDKNPESGIEKCLIEKDPKVFKEEKIAIIKARKNGRS